MQRLENKGYNINRQVFDYLFYEELQDAQLNRVSPNPETYVYGEDFLTMDYSGSGNPTANLIATNDIVIPSGGEPRAPPTAGARRPTSRRPPPARSR